MRNIVEYPITTDDAVRSLDWATTTYTRNINQYGVGGVEGISLQVVRRFIQLNSEIFDVFAENEIKRILVDKNE